MNIRNFEFGMDAVMANREVAEKQTPYRNILRGGEHPDFRTLSSKMLRENMQGANGKGVKVSAYKVGSLECDRIMANWPTTLEQAVRNILGYPVRLENLLKFSDEKHVADMGNGLDQFGCSGSKDGGQFLRFHSFTFRFECQQLRMWSSGSLDTGVKRKTFFLELSMTSGGFSLTPFRMREYFPSPFTLQCDPRMEMCREISFDIISSLNMDGLTGEKRGDGRLRTTKAIDNSGVLARISHHHSFSRIEARSMKP